MKADVTRTPSYAVLRMALLPSAKLAKLSERRPSHLSNPLARHEILLGQSQVFTTKTAERIHFIL